MSLGLADQRCCLRKIKILIATGSEVNLALQAQGMLAEKGVAASVVSMPSWELFEKMPSDVQNKF